MPDPNSRTPVARALEEAEAAVAAALRALRAAAEAAEAAPAEEPPFVSVREAGRRLGVHRATIMRRVADGSLPSKRVGGRRLLLREAVDSLAADRAGLRP
jgi:excisionase family DNA binding protein